ncbi:hypothetical protein RN69_15115 [Bradyrhizobium japonicum]|nr:hypothetical protein RN69_15115 [Bradyrhizobium japonicum]KMJ95147.1 hypothetical protein CF64_33330 [Bradyrhizobium japonicum]
MARDQTYFGVSERNEPSLLLVPQGLRHTSQALDEGDSAHICELRMIPEHVRQPIAGNSTA